jgi:molybdopterin-binding protein
VPLTAEVTSAAVAELGLLPGLELHAGVKATEVVSYPA